MKYQVPNDAKTWPLSGIALVAAGLILLVAVMAYVCRWDAALGKRCDVLGDRCTELTRVSAMHATMLGDHWTGMVWLRVQQNDAGTNVVNLSASIATLRKAQLAAIKRDEIMLEAQARMDRALDVLEGQR